MLDHINTSLFKEDLSSPLYDPSEVYLGFRQMVFHLPSRDVTPMNNGGIIAFLMEVGSDDATFCYSLVAVADGAASIYFSN
jgi:hypothetical protein